MSWQEYIDRLLEKGVERAAVHGVDGNVWATSKDLQVPTEEIKTLSALITNPEYTNGMRVHGKKFFIVQIKEGCAVGKAGSENVIVMKLEQCLIIGESNNDNLNAGSLMKALGDIADHLRPLGY